jgi:gas vesicle protein
MKKFAVLLSLVAFVFAFTSCNSGPEGDAKKLMDKQEALIEMQQKAAKDGELSDKEIDNIVNEFKAFMEFSSELEEKYEEDSAGNAQLNEELETMQKEIQDKYKDIDMSDVEGYDKLNEKMFEVMFSESEESEE